MSKPPFVMSKYAKREDLLADAASYYERRAKELEAVARVMRQAAAKLGDKDND